MSQIFRQVRDHPFTERDSLNVAEYGTKVKKNGTAVDPAGGYCAATLRGGWYNTTTLREPQRGQRSRPSSRESGNALPRVQTNVSMSNSLR